MKFFRHKGRTPLRITSKQGITLIDETGKHWKDLSGGTLVQTLSDLSDFTKSFDSIEFVQSYGITTPEMAQLEERLFNYVHPSFLDLFWTSSGSDAIEICVKLALHQLDIISKPDSCFVTYAGSYHSNSIFSSIFNSRPGKTSNYTNRNEPLRINDFKNWQEQVRDFESHNRAAYSIVLIDPLNITGKNLGANLEELDEFIFYMKSRGAIVILDEIACGCYRHGYFSITSRLKNCPDFTILSKGLTSGITPLSVLFTSNKKIIDRYCNDSISIGHTFGLTPFSCKAASWVMHRYDTLLKDGKLEQLHSELSLFASRFKRFENHKAEVVGNTMRITLLSNDTYRSFKDAMNEAGLMIYESKNIEGNNVFVICPPYDIDPTILNECLTRVYQAINSIYITQ